MSYRSSVFIDFDTGVVRLAPMSLLDRLPQSWSLVDKLDFFECRVDVWQFGPAIELLKKIESAEEASAWFHSAYALLAIGFSYFEMLGKTLNPRAGKSSRDFSYGFCDVYPAFEQNPDDVHEFYNRVRNGMYHLAFTKRNLLIHNDDTISVEDFFVQRDTEHPIYFVNPHRMTRKIVAHFPSFIAKLRAPTAATNGLQKRFVRFVDEFLTAGRGRATPD